MAEMPPESVSGYVTGEGCFYVESGQDKKYRLRNRIRPAFCIEVREDDKEILEYLNSDTIESFESKIFEFINNKWRERGEPIFIKRFSSRKRIDFFLGVRESIGGLYEDGSKRYLTLDFTNRNNWDHEIQRKCKELGFQYEAPQFYILIEHALKCTE